jgi:hypothetical protein
MRGILRTFGGRARTARTIAHAAAMLALLSASGVTIASERSDASTSAAARDEARRAIALAKVDPAHRQAVSDVLADPSIFRRLPTNVIDCRPELFTFIVQNPDVLVAIWRQLGVSGVELTRTGENTFRLSDGAGTTGKMTIVEQNCDAAAQNRVVMYVEGVYEGKPFNKPIAAQCVLVLRSGSTTETNGRVYVATRLDSFVKLDRASIELVAKAVHPFVGQTADRNFADSLTFVSNLSFTAEKRPETIEKLAGELTGVEVRSKQELARLSHVCAEAGRVWRLSRATQTSADRIR